MLFRSNGIMKINNKRTIITGTALILNTDSQYNLYYLAMDLSTMTAYWIFCSNINIHSKTTLGDKVFTCSFGFIGNNNAVSLEGTITMRGTINEASFSGKVVTENNDNIELSCSGKRSKYIYFQPKEAGLRATYFVGQSIKRYIEPQVIAYAIFDSPYGKFSCRELMKFETWKAEPGAIIVGKSKETCGIINDSGTKFVHASQITNTIVSETVDKIGDYFKEGYVFKKIPEE